MHEITSKYDDLKHSYMNLEEFGKERDEIIALKDSLERDLKREKKDRQQQVNELERDKIKATESLRKEMLHKIKETKANLLALNDE